MFGRDGTQRAEFRLGRILKQSTCGAGALCHNRLRRVCLSPNADFESIGEQKANIKDKKKMNLPPILNLCSRAFSRGIGQ